LRILLIEDGEALSMSQENHVLDSLPAFALSALEEDEARLVSEHLGGCYRCRTELQAFQEIADQLSLAVPEARPSAALKPRLMERIHGLSPKRPQSAGKLFPARLLPVGAMVALLLIVALAVSNLWLWQRLNQLEVLAGPLGMRAIALQNTEAAPGASGFVVISADGEDGVLVVDELPTLDPQREYQLWLAGEESSVSGAVFSVDESGYRGLRIEAPESLLVYSAVYITIEPAGGSANPTGEQVMDGSLFNP
jgi:anti-sigma-K factor RskA